MPFEMQTTSQATLMTMQRIKASRFVTNHAIKKTIGCIKKPWVLLVLSRVLKKNQIASLGFWGFASPVSKQPSMDMDICKQCPYCPYRGSHLARTGPNIFQGVFLGIFVKMRRIAS
jgi:hypothetical protein